MNKKTFLVSAAIAATLAPAARAQVAQGFQADRFNPSERGSEWFALDTLDMRGEVRPAMGVVAEWASAPFTLRKPDGSPGGPTVVDSQMFLHAGASLVLFERFRLGLNVPINIVDSGSTQTASSGQVFFAPNNTGLGDSRVSLDVRLFGRYGEGFTMAAGTSYFVPTGAADNYTGDNLSHGNVHLLGSGEAGIFNYSFNVGYQFRARETTLDGQPYGSGLIYGLALGLRFADRHLLIGPELYGETNTAASGAFFKTSTPLEVILGGHYTIGDDWRVGLGAGPGITRDMGSPAVRILGGIEWTPGYHPKPKEEKPAPTPADRDGDGVLDKDDACPDTAGVKTDDPKSNGCPPDKDGDGVIDSEDACPDKPGVKTDDPKTNGCPPDKDGDGIVDAEDACPDVKGVKTDDPKTNGCPPDKDGDGIADADDACPDVKGVKTDNPKTNGCPPDRDGDGILDADDACPDAPGPKTDDPKTNGCPKAAVVNGMIKISEQVKFATGSSKILKDSDELLGAVADIFLKHPEIKVVRIEGHTDNKGNAKANKALSQARADSVKAWLVKHGIDKGRLKTQGFGQEKPIDDNSTDKGRANNRRVEFHIEDQGTTPPPAN